MGQYEIHVFVCTGGPWCPRDGDAAGVHRMLKQLVGAADLRDRIRINHSGCLNQCGHGPMMVVYPENVWYHQMTPEKARRVFEEHFLGGRPVDSLRYVNRPGANQMPRDAEGNVADSPEARLMEDG